MGGTGDLASGGEEHLNCSLYVISKVELLGLPEGRGWERNKGGKANSMVFSLVTGRMKCSFSATDHSLGGQVGRHGTSGIQLGAWEVRMANWSSKWIQ